MQYRETPKFIIKNNLQKSRNTGIYFDQLITPSIMEEICFKVTGRKDYEVDFVDNTYKDKLLSATYNKGRLAILQYHSTVNYISFSDQKYHGRDSAFQSVPTAFNMFFSNPDTNKKLFFYFLPCSGNNATPYCLFMYRLMKTAGFEFLNTPDILVGQVNAFSSIEDIIRARKENKNRRPNKNPTFIEKSGIREYEIYGKTYGANKYATSLICYAISTLATKRDIVTLFEYNEKTLRELPRQSLTVLRSMGNINIIKIDDELEKNELENNDSLRSPRFNARLFDRLGERHCVLCNCGISEIIQGAHIWPVSEIKKSTVLSDKKKLDCATDGENGLWMCQNHHKMFDSDIICLAEDGSVTIKDNLELEDENYIHSVTTVSTLPSALINDKYKEYIKKRYSL